MCRAAIVTVSLSNMSVFTVLRSNPCRYFWDVRSTTHQVLICLMIYSGEVVRKADKAIGRHTKRQIKLCEYSYSLQAEKFTENFQ